MIADHTASRCFDSCLLILDKIVCLINIIPLLMINFASIAKKYRKEIQAINPVG